MLEILNSINTEWVEAIHVIAVIAWMSGMLYLPRLFVYHARASVGSEMDLTFQKMERRLLRIIMNPAMVIAVLCGTLLLLAEDLLSSGEMWVHIKLGLVLIMIIVHGALAKFRKDFALSKNLKSPRFYTILNESIVLVMVLIVIMVIVKPF